jgi:hypothetical protein
MINDQARVSLVAERNGAVGCELCTAETAVTNAAVVIQHPRGGVVRLAVCDWCVRALRRLAASTGGNAAFALTEGNPGPASQPIAPSGARPASPPVLILELVQQIRDPVDGALYIPRVYGRARVDGTWEGWIEFAAVRAATVVRTDQETTQSNREGVAYWASGLEPAYLEGAFARARARAAA